MAGNLHAAAPYGDLAPVLLALDATVRLVGTGGERTRALADWLTERATDALRCSPRWWFHRRVASPLTAAMRAAQPTRRREFYETFD